MAIKRHWRWDYGLLFVAGLLLYSATLQTDVQAADSGEFQVVAWTFGIAHPPGYPLFTLISGLFAHLPLGSPYAQMAFMSALVSAITLVLVAASTAKITQTQHFSTLLPALALATSTTFWAQATTVNIRSLTTFFMALMLWAMLQNTRWGLILFFAAFGLGVGHHLSLLFPGAVFAVYVLVNWLRSGAIRRAHAIGLAVIIAAASQLVWLYLPIRDAANARFAPGNLNTFANVLYHIRGGGFEGDMLYFVFKEPQLLWDRLALLPQLLTFQFGPVLPWLMALAALSLLIRRTWLACTLLLAFALHLFITLTYRAPQTVEYALPAWLIACVTVGEIKNLKFKMENGKLDQFLIPNFKFFILNFKFAILMVFVGLNFSQRLPSFVTLANDHSVRDAAQRTLENAAPNSHIFAQWHQATPMWALQSIDGLRPDVTVEYVDPRGGEAYATQFARRVAQSTAPARYATSYDATAFAAANLCAIPQQAIPVWEVFSCPLTSAKPSATAPSPLLFDGRIDVFSVKPDREAIQQGGRFEVIVIWRAAAGFVDGDSLSVRLMYPDGRLASNIDLRLDPQQQPGQVQAQRITLSVPLDLPLGPRPLLIGAYRGGQIFKTPANSDFVAVESLLVQPNTSKITQHPPGLIRFADQMQLMAANIQRRGDVAIVDLDWLALQPLTTDYIVSVRLEGDGFFKSHDGVPALGAIPTLKWLAGSRITDRHVIALGGYRGPLRGRVVVYDSATGLLLPKLSREVLSSEF